MKEPNHITPQKVMAFAMKEDNAHQDAKISESKVDITKRMVGLAIAIVGLIIAFMKFS